MDLDQTPDPAGTAGTDDAAAHEAPDMSSEPTLPGMPEPLPQAAAADADASTGTGTKPPKARRGIERAAKKAGMPVRATCFSVPVSLDEAWRERAKRDGATRVDVLLTAIASQRGALGDLVRERKRGRRPVLTTAPDGLFLQAAPPATKEPLVAVPLRLLSANVDIIDGLVEEAGAESRSALAVAALEAWLAAGTVAVGQSSGSEDMTSRNAS